MKRKSDAAAATARFISDIAPYGNIKILRSDNAMEYCSKEYQELMDKNGIKREYSAPYSAHQNGTAERANRTIFEMARCLISQGELPKKLWNYAVRHSAYVRNRCINNRLKMTPVEAFTSVKPNLNAFELFGSKCFAYVQDKQKLDDRAKEGKFVGYDPLSPALLVYFNDEAV